LLITDKKVVVWTGLKVIVDQEIRRLVRVRVGIRIESDLVIDWVDIRDEVSDRTVDLRYGESTSDWERT